VYIMNIKAIT